MQLGQSRIRLIAVEKGSLLLLEAFGTYAVRRLVAACGFLDFIYQNTRWEFGKLVALLLFAPCFDLAYAIFKFVYLSRQRRLALLGADCAFLGGQDLSRKFSDLHLDGMGLFQVLHVLSETVSRLKSSERLGIGIRGQP